MSRRAVMQGLLCAELVQWTESALPDAVVQRLPLAAAARAPGPAAFLALVEALHLQVGEPGALLRTFGIHLFSRLASRYPAFFVDAAGAVPFLTRLETHVVGEVRKLDPSASVPDLGVRRRDGGVVELLYAAAPALVELADGLVRGCVLHFDDAATVVREDLRSGLGTAVRFVITPAAAARPCPGLGGWGAPPA